VVDGNPTLVEVPGTGICELGSVGRPITPSSITDHSMNNGLIAVHWNLDGEIN